MTNEGNKMKQVSNEELENRMISAEEQISRFMNATAVLCRVIADQTARFMAVIAVLQARVAELETREQNSNISIGDVGDL